MAVDERSRHELYEQARRTWNDRAAEALMELLPPVGWADVARRSDIEALATRMDGANDALRAEFHQTITRLIMWLVPLNIGLAFSAARLAG